MNKKRVISYVMAATLLVGGTFAGTKALFTDNEELVSELSISTGDLDIEAQGEEWNLDRDGEEENIDTNGQSKEESEVFDNLKTGDVLTKEVTITNNGTLTAIVNLEKNEEKPVNLPDGIIYTASFKNTDEVVDGKITMPMGSSTTIELRLEVTKGGKHEEEGSLNNNEQEKATINLNDSYKVTATQKTDANDAK